MPGRDRFTGLRIEHRPPDGPPRLLAETTVWNVALQSATSWLGLLTRQGRTGAVAIVDAATGEALYAYPIPRNPAPR
jgi:hypothetical protein